MRKIVLILVLIFTPLLTPTHEVYSKTNSEYAVIITIDGLRPDAISKAKAPNLKALINGGSYSPSAKTVDPPKTLPSHTSLVTGLTPKRHLTFINEWVDSIGYTEFDTIFTIAKEEGFETAMFIGKNKLNYIAVPGSIDELEVFKYDDHSVANISESFRSYFKASKPRITLIHFPEPDIPGHKYGWMSKEYFQAIERVDLEIGRMIEAIKQAGLYHKTIVIITADHGGLGKTHRGDHPEVTTIPWLAVGNNVKKGYIINEQVYIYDTAPTVLHSLGLKPINNPDGKNIEEIFVQ